MENNSKSNQSRQIAYGLIVLGIAIFVVNTGLLNLGSWLSLQFLPFAVIALGAFLLLGKRSGTIAAIVVLGVGAIFSYFQPQIPGIANTKSEIHQVEQIHEGAQTAKIEISPSVAKLNINALNNSNLLAEGSIKTHGNEKLITEFAIDGGHAEYSLKAKKKNRLNNFSNGGFVWDLELNPNIPLDLEISTGVGDSNLDLLNFNLTKLDIETGVGDSEITLPKGGNFKSEIDSGVGEVIVKIPNSLAIRIKVSKGVGSINVDEEFEKRDGYYYSSNYDSSSKRVELDIDTGVGDITIKSF